MLAFLTAAPAVAVRPRPSLVESSFSIHALAVQASPEPSPSPSPLPAANTDATGMCGLELVYTPVGLSGAIEAFAFRADGKIVHSHARSASAAVWTPFRPVGDEDGAETRKFASGPTVVRAADGRLEVVARGMDGALYVKYQLAPNGVRGWGPWVRVDGGPAFAGVPSAVLSAEGFLQLFARSASSGEIMYNGQLRNASGVYWSGWQSLGGSFAAGPWAVLDAESLLHVFAVDASGVLLENVEATAPPSGDCSWAGWTSLDGGVATGARVSVVLNGANLLEVYAPRAADGALAVKRQQVPPAAAASARTPLPASLRARTPPLPPTARRRTPRSSPSAGRRGGPCSTGGARSRARPPRASPRTPTPRSCMRAPPPAASPRARSSRTRSSTPPPPAARRASGRRGASSAPAPSSPPPPSPRRSAPAASAAPTSTSSSSAPTAARATPSAPRTPARPPPPSAPPTRRSRRRRARGAAGRRCPTRGSGCGRTRAEWKA